MSLKIKPSNFAKGFIAGALVFNLLWSALIVVVILQRGGEKRAPLDRSGRETQRRITFQEVSPDGQKKITRYELSYQPQLFSDSHITYLDNKVIISAVNNIGDAEREYYLFTGEERTGNPHWLSNKFVFFTAYCGSSCQRLTLLDVESGQRWLAMLSFISNARGDKNGGWRTHFQDWFDQDFEFEGLVQKIHGELVNNVPYLVFDVEGDGGTEIGQVRFLFTGRSLILER